MGDVLSELITGLFHFITTRVRPYEGHHWLHYAILEPGPETRTVYHVDLILGGDENSLLLDDLISEQLLAEVRDVNLLVL